MKIKYYGTAAAEGIPGLFCSCEVCEKARKSGGKNIRTRSQTVINDDLMIDFSDNSGLYRLKQEKLYFGFRFLRAVLLLLQCYR